MGGYNGKVTRQQAAGSAWAQVEAAQRQVRLPCLLGAAAGTCRAGGRTSRGLDTALANCPRRSGGRFRCTIRVGPRATRSRFNGCAPGARTRAIAAPVSFIAIPPGEAEEAWTASIDAVEAFSKLGAMVVSRHFSLLAQHDQGPPPAVSAGGEVASTKARSSRGNRR